MVPVHPGTGEVLRQREVPEFPVSELINGAATFDEKVSALQKVTKLLGTSGKVKQIKEVVNTELPVVAVAWHKTQNLEAPRVVFTLEDGSAVDSVSWGALDFAQTLVRLFGVGPWPRPIRIIPRSVPTQSGFTYTFEVVG
jgi:hypothetical protein